MIDAVAISGGAALLFWQAGVVAQLLRRGVAPTRYCGTSAGALVAALAAAGRIERVQLLAGELSGATLFPQPGGLLRFPRLWRRFKRTGGLLDVRPLRKLIADELPNRVLEKIPRDCLEVAAFSYARGTTEYFRPESNSGERFREAVLASASIPFVFPPVVLETVGRGYLQQFADGGVTDNFPIERLVAQLVGAPGGARLWIVSATQTYPQARIVPPGSIEWLLEALSRLTSATLHHDARLSREYAERFGYLGDRLRWIQAPPLELDLASFSPFESLNAFRQGQRSAGEALKA